MQKLRDREGKICFPSKPSSRRQSQNFDTGILAPQRDYWLPGSVSSTSFYMDASKLYQVP